MLANVALISHLSALLAFALLALLLAISSRNRPYARLIILASLASVVWAIVGALAALRSVPLVLVESSELLRIGSWTALLLRIIENRLREHHGSSVPWLRWYGVILLALATYVLSAPYWHAQSPAVHQLLQQASGLGMLLLAVIGLLLLENLFRNTPAEERWAIKLLCLGLGLLYAYDFYLYADALLFQQINPALWTARGAVNMLAVPLIAVSLARNPKWEMGIHVSRDVVFHSVTLVGAGVYLLVMAAAGYFIRYLGGSWSGVLQIALLAGSGVLLLVLLFSGSIRARLRVLLSKHFFSYKYDYREEWQKFTRTLAQGEAEVPQRVLQAMAALVNSPGGALWLRDDNGQQRLQALQRLPAAPETDARSLQQLADWLSARSWVIDLDEYRHSPDIYGSLALPPALLTETQAWLIVPLLLDESLEGIALVLRSPVQRSINWEDRDLLKVAGMQAASHLAQYRANQALTHARQFEAFNRLSAYVVHDLKNILAQQSLIVANAEKHRHKPAFVDDVIATVGNSVARMTRLMEQMHSGLRGRQVRPVSVAPLLEDVVQRCAAAAPIPILTPTSLRPVIHADPEQLATVFTHIVENAQQATPADGSVTIELSALGDSLVVEICDTGCGMDSDFVRERLFRPFDSTKGLTGMGVGAFESRETVRALGGDILVDSTPGQGSRFRIVLPYDHLKDEDAA